MGDWTPRFSLVNRIYRELLKMLLFPACIYRSLKSSTLAQEPDDSIDEFFKFVFPQVVKALSLLTFPCTHLYCCFLPLQRCSLSYLPLPFTNIVSCPLHCCFPLAISLLCYVST